MFGRPRYRPVVAEERFDVLFDGPAIRDGRISAEALAASLLALSAAAQSAHLAIDPLAPRISLEIQATTAGSFEVDLLITDAVVWLNSDTVSAFETGGSIVGMAASAIVGSVALIKWLRGRKLREASGVKPGQTQITAQDGSTIIVDSSVYIAVQDRTFRESMRDAVEPVAQDGIDFIQIGRGDIRERVTAADLPAFEVPAGAEVVLSETPREAFLQISSVSFQPGTKWKFTEGAAPYWAAMRDREFAGRVERREVEFGKGDILRATVLTKQSRSGAALRVENTVIKVHEILKQAKQVEFQFGDDDDPDA